MAVDIFQAAYILHSRQYTDSRVIVELLCEQAGKTSVVARPSKKQHAVLVPFQRLQVCLHGSGGLKTLSRFESDMGCPYPLKGKMLYCGFYVNELVQRALPEADPHSHIFSHYELCLKSLAELDTLSDAELPLRQFEFQLLEELGIGWDYRYCAVSGRPIDEEKHYQLDLERGFCQVEEAEDFSRGVFSGKKILALASESFQNKAAMQAAKAICRMALAPVIGSKPLKSRELFI